MRMQRDSRGFSLLEMLIGLTVLMLAMGALATMLIQNSRLNKSQQMAVQTQSNARSCLSIVVQKLRSAGWDPQNVGVPTVVLDPENTDGNHADGVDNIEVFADLNADAETDGTTTNDDDNEQVLIRHVQQRLEWRPTSDTTAPFVILANNITNDSNGDGVAEPMFVPDSGTDPTRIAVRITARSPTVDPVNGDFIRYTVSSEVLLRKSL